MAARPPDADRNQEATVYIGNIDERCNDALIWELMLQAGPVINVHLPKDRVSMTHQGFGFCEFQTEQDADYACKIMNQIKLFGKPIRVNKASYDRKQLDVGANLFIGNLDPMVDETLLYTTFSTFGQIAQQVKIARDTTTGESKGYGFVAYNDFDASDAAIEAMQGQYLANKPINVEYAFKKDGKGERHGTEAERLLAQEAKKHAVLPGMPGYQGPPYPGGGGSMAPGAASGANGIPMAAPPPGIPVYQPNMAVAGGVPPSTSSSFPPPPAGFPPQTTIQQQQQQPLAYGAVNGGPPPPPPPSMPGYMPQQLQQQPPQGIPIAAAAAGYPPPPLQGYPQYAQQQQQGMGGMPPPPPPPSMMPGGGGFGGGGVGGAQGYYQNR